MFQIVKHLLDISAQMSHSPLPYSLCSLWAFIQTLEEQCWIKPKMVHLVQHPADAPGKPHQRQQLFPSRQPILGHELFQPISKANSQRTFHETVQSPCGAISPSGHSSISYSSEFRKSMMRWWMKAFLLSILNTQLNNFSRWPQLLKFWARK